MNIKISQLSILLCIAATSCVSVNEQRSSISETSVEQRKLVADLHKIKTGMSLQEVKAVLSDKLLIGYRIEGSPQKLNPITIEQPYKEEDLTKGDSTYKVLYYYNTVIKPDDIVTDEELMPLIFENGYLIGKGLADLDRIKRM